MYVKKGNDFFFYVLVDVLKLGVLLELVNWYFVIVGLDDYLYGYEMKVFVEKFGIVDWVIWIGMLMGDLKWGVFYCVEVFVLLLY